MLYRINLKKSSSKQNIKQYLSLSVGKVLKHPEMLSPKPGHEQEEQIVLRVLKNWRQNGCNDSDKELRKIVRNVKYLHEIDNNLKPVFDSTDDKSVFILHLDEK